MDDGVRRFDLAAGRDAPHEARRIVAALDRLPPERIAVVQLVVSELVTNAVRHAALRPGEPITLTVRHEDGRYRVDVDDGGDGRWPPRAPGPGGMGLAAVVALSEHLEAHGGRVTSWIAV